MPIHSGARLGVYEIVAPLGAGGMGEVYRARDTRLGRDVALKVLPADVAGDAERLARFEREAQVLASLNHPNIAQIYGVEDSTGTLALVMEVVEGPTLADRVAAGPIAVDEVLAIAKQIAEGLAAAHEQGIIHRDLKPANIKVRDDGAVKILDFGLAKAFEAKQPSTVNATMSPTITTPAMMTGVGVILGTAAYMSPEQAKGRPADKRSDVWAFGCVLYEMLTGKRAFEGEDVGDTLANILKATVDWTAIPKDTPQHVELLLRRCFEKNRAARISDLGTALFILSQPDPEKPATHRGRLAMASLAAVIVVATAIIAIASRSFTRPVPAAVTRFSVPLAADTPFTASGRHLIALSPNGRRLVFAAGSQLNVRFFDRLESTPIRGTGGEAGAFGRSPFFSPDGEWVGFWQDGKIKKVRLDGGIPVDVCEAGNPYGASWTSANEIWFGEAEGIFRVSALGGKPQLVIRDADGLAHGPQILPGGRAVIYTLAPRDSAVGGGWDQAQIRVHSLDTGQREVLVTGGTDARYVATGHLLYVAGGTLLATPFDVKTLKVTGSAVPLVDQVAQSPIQTGAAHFSVSESGTLAYVPGSFTQTISQLPVWLDRSGRETPIAVPARSYLYPRVSPDGKKVAVTVRDADSTSVWMIDTARQTLERFIQDRRIANFPIWSPDGMHVAFSATSVGDTSIYWQRADGSGTAKQLTPNNGSGQLPNAFAPEGTRIVLFEPNTSALSLATVQEPARVETLLRKPGLIMRNADISPRGSWMAYDSNESGGLQVFVRPFPNVDAGRWQVSTDGGHSPAWSRDGRELFYVARTGGLMRVVVSDGVQWSATTPTKVVDGSYTWTLQGLNARMYDVAPSNDRFIVLKAVADGPHRTPPTSMTVVENWFEELKARAPAK